MNTIETHHAPEKAAIIILLVLFCLFANGCSTNIGTRQVGFQKVYEQINTNALFSDHYSTTSGNVLHRSNIIKLFEVNPEKALLKLHENIPKDNRRDLLFALAELSYHTAKKMAKVKNNENLQRARKYFLAAAVYAYFYLFAENYDQPVDPYDRKFRWACDLYNIALARAMSDSTGSLTFKSGPRELPFGTIFLTVKEHHQSQWATKEETYKIIAADQLSVYGLSQRNRNAGLGLPFVVVKKEIGNLPLKLSFPATMFLRIDGNLKTLGKESLTGQMEFYTPFSHKNILVRGSSVSLENDISVPLAYTLNQPLVWTLGKKEFFTGKERVPSGLYKLFPYSRGKIPIVFVHGTFSSPVKWAEMINTLLADPEIVKRYQVWFYFYNSNKPVNMSANLFREALTNTLTDLDPDTQDQGLNNMVIVGHSQGGLLAKFTAMDTGDKVIRELTGKGLDEFDITKIQMKNIQKNVIFKPLPFVRRVVFISTPHRGSRLVEGWVQNLMQDLVSLPEEDIEEISEGADAFAQADMPDQWEKITNPTSIDSMAPNNPALLAYAKIPLAKGIKGHSIIAIKGGGDPTKGSDGVVEYRSAHIDYVESEFIVQPSSHSCQGHPLVIEEIRRILLKHLSEMALMK